MSTDVKEQPMKTVNGVVDDTHIYYMVEGALRRVQVKAYIENIGVLLQWCLDSGLDALWIMPNTKLSDRATKDFVEAESVKQQWKIMPTYKKKEFYKDGKERCTFARAWKIKEERGKEESSRTVCIGYAKHNSGWRLDDVNDPVALLGAITYLEDALQFRVAYSPSSVGRRLMIRANKRHERVKWVRPVNLKQYPEVVRSRMTDITWKRHLTEEEMAMSHLIAADKNSMHPASCTRVRLGEGEPERVKRPAFDMEKPPTGVFHCRVTGTSEFDGVKLPHPLQRLRYKEVDGALEGWFWTYTVLLLKEVGYSVDIIEGDIWRESHTVLRPWVEGNTEFRGLWNARAILDDKNPECNLVRYKNAEARKLAYGAVKPILNTSLGLLASEGDFNEEGEVRQWYRPDWYWLLIDNARYQMFRKIRALLDKGLRLVGIHIDCLYFIANTDNHEEALPGLLDRWDKLGGYKRKFDCEIPVSVAALFFNNPQLSMDEVNKELLRYEAEVMAV